MPRVSNWCRISQPSVARFLGTMDVFLGTSLINGAPWGPQHLRYSECVVSDPMPSLAQSDEFQDDHHWILWMGMRLSETTAWCREKSETAKKNMLHMALEKPRTASGFSPGSLGSLVPQPRFLQLQSSNSLKAPRCWSSTSTDSTLGLADVDTNSNTLSPLRLGTFRDQIPSGSRCSSVEHAATARGHQTFVYQLILLDPFSIQLTGA